MTLKFIQVIFNNSVHTVKKTQHFTIRKIICLMLYNEKHTKPINTKCRLKAPGAYSYRSSSKGLRYPAGWD